MNNENINKLQLTLDTCMDGAKGYETAAKNLEDGELTTIFNRLSQQRKLFAEELKTDFRDFGLELTSEGTTAGFFHRNWIEVKSFFSSSDNSVVIESAINGEKEAIERYEELISYKLPGVINTRLEGQLTLIKGSLSLLHDFNKQVAS
jgi:uncharacterized protein (TIGR02284 family)